MNIGDITPLPFTSCVVPFGLELIEHINRERNFQKKIVDAIIWDTLNEGIFYYDIE